MLHRFVADLPYVDVGAAMGCSEGAEGECVRRREEVEGEAGMTREPRETSELEALMTAAVKSATEDFARRAEAEDLVDIAYRPSTRRSVRCWLR